MPPLTLPLVALWLLALQAQMYKVMKIQTNDQTGEVILFPSYEPTPKIGYSVRTVTTEIQAILDQGGPFLWVPTDPANPEGGGTLTKVAPDPMVAIKKAAWNAAAAVFEAMPLGKQALWEPVRVKVAAFIQAGDFVSAATTIATVPTLYEGMDADRAMFLALFKQ